MRREKTTGNLISGGDSSIVSKCYKRHYLSLNLSLKPGTTKESAI